MWIRLTQALGNTAAFWMDEAQSRGWWPPSSSPAALLSLQLSKKNHSGSDQGQPQQARGRCQGGTLYHSDLDLHIHFENQTPQ